LIDLKTGMVDRSKLKVGEMEELFASSGHKYALQLLFYGLIYVREEALSDPGRVHPAIIGFRDLGQGAMELGMKKGAPYQEFGELFGAFETALKGELKKLLDPEPPIVEGHQEVGSDQ
jgi:hypothetical protein